jgi:cell volume regulation protein A
MLAGSEGPGGIDFTDAGLAQSIGIIALVFILFAGGMDTNWQQVKPILTHAIRLSTLGVFITALSVGLFAHYVLKLSFLSGMLLGAVISSTDAAAVFSVLRSKKVSLKGQLKPLLELESGSNDPMAVFLTIGLIQLMSVPQTTVFSILFLFVFQMGIGALLGWLLGKAMVFILNRLKLSYEGIYPVFSLAFVALLYGLTASINGSGFLAVYVAGLMAGKSEFIYKKSLLRFFDGLAWLGQISMFVTLGLLVFPSHLLPVLGSGLLVSAFLMFIARPISVFLSLIFSKLRWIEKIFISWVGLRGAVPIILATFPLIAGLPDAELIFNLVFFIVFTSALIQGWSIPPIARLFRLDAPFEKKQRYPIEFEAMQGTETELIDLIVPYQSAIAGRPIVQLGLPRDSLIVLISRDENFLVPSGGTILQEADTVLVLVNKDNLEKVREIFSQLKTIEEK